MLTRVRPTLVQTVEVATAFWVEASSVPVLLNGRDHAATLVRYIIAIRLHTILKRTTVCKIAVEKQKSAKLGDAKAKCNEPNQAIFLQQNPN